MNEIERALSTLQDLLDNSIFSSRIDFALEVAIEALQDRLKESTEEKHRQEFEEWFFTTYGKKHM